MRRRNTNVPVPSFDGTVEVELAHFDNYELGSQGRGDSRLSFVFTSSDCGIAAIAPVFTYGLFSRVGEGRFE